MRLKILKVFDSVKLSENALRNVNLTAEELIEYNFFMDNLDHLESDLLEKYYEVLLWLEPQSFIYVLSKVLLLEYEESRKDNYSIGLALEVVIGMLDFQDGIELTEFTKERFSLLTSVQKELIIIFFYDVCTKDESFSDDSLLRAISKIENI